MASDALRIDIRLTVFPDGRGSIMIAGKPATTQPVNGPDEVVRLLKDLWEQAARTRDVPFRDVPSELDELLSQITPENVHGEIDFGGPVGREVW